MAVYFAQAPDGFIKIGESAWPAQRIKALWEHGRPVRLLAVIGDEATALDLEREMLGRFAEYRESGEWFRPAPAIMEFVASVADTRRFGHCAHLDGPRFAAGEKLAAWRKANGLTQLECAKLVGVTGGCWSRWESTAMEPTASRVVLLEVITGGAVRVADWLTEDDVTRIETARLAADRPKRRGKAA